MTLILSLSQRQENARDHARVLAELLDRPAPKGAPHRIFRARLWMELIPADHDYLVMTIVQNLKASQLKAYVRRPFTQAIGPGSLVAMEANGTYSVDEVVAFLMLDRLSVEDVQWRDETGSDLVTASDILGQFQG